MPNTVLVTGGAQRLGAEIVRLFAKEGWQVWCHYQRSEAQAQALMQQVRDQGGSIEVIQAELSQFAEIDHMMRTIASTSGALDVLVNNASMFEPDSGTQFSPELALQQLKVNLLAPMYLGKIMAHQHGAQAMSLEIHPCIIHILDQKVFNLNPDYFTYTLSKLALERAVAVQAQALAPRVRVNAVAPGLMYPSGPQSLENFELASRVNLLRKAVAPSDVAATCWFLACNSSITGVSVAVDNGQHLVPLSNDVMNVVENYLAHLEVKS